MFKDTMNRWLTAGLFHETSSKEGTSLYSLDKAREKFLELSDMTGYKFSQEMLGGYQHWQALEASKISFYLEEWKDELEVKMRSESLSRIVEVAESGHYQSNKFLMDRGWDTRGAGRPSKLEVAKQVKQNAKVVEASKRFLSPIRS